MEIIPQIFTAKVMHKRLFPKVNKFTYGVYYLALPLSKLDDELTTDSLAINRRGLLSFFEKDHVYDGESKAEGWIRKTLEEHGLNDLVKEIVLITMPRVLGYAFNPVSFWLCLDDKSNLRAVLCEVNNTFGEVHNYLCVKKDNEIITGDDWLTAEKLFHVSPFLEREGIYKFRFSVKDNKLGIWIDYYDSENNKKLITSLVGEMEPLSKKALRKAFWKHWHVTLKTILLIHWNAVRLLFKGVKYVTKPTQREEKLSTTNN